MKKVFSLLAVLALVCMAGTVWAVQPIKTTAAYATFAEDPLSFEVALYNWVKNTAFDSYSVQATSISFNLGNITLGNAESQWAGAQTFAKVSSNLAIQKAGTSVYMFTKNQSNTDGFAANHSRAGTGSSTVYNGLVRKGNTSAAQDGDFAPLEMKCVAKSKASSYVSSDPTATAFALNGQMDVGERYLLDLADSNWSSAGEQGQLIGKSGANGGLWAGFGVPEGSPAGTQASNWYVNEDVLIFFGARFDHVIGGDEFGTNTITFSISAE